MLGTEKKVRVLHDLNKSDLEKGQEETSMKREGEGGNAALWVSFIAVIVVMVAYFAVDTKLSALTETVKNVPTLETKVSGLETQVAALKDLPATVKNMFLRDQMAQLSLMMSRLSAGLETDDQRAVAKQAEELMGKLQALLIPAVASTANPAVAPAD